MGLEKAIKYGKEKRKEWKYKKNYCKSVAKSCRNHGGCPYCEGNRLFGNKRRMERYKEEEGVV